MRLVRCTLINLIMEDQTLGQSKLVGKHIAALLSSAFLNLWIVALPMMVQVVKKMHLSQSINRI